MGKYVLANGLQISGFRAVLNLFLGVGCFCCGYVFCEDKEAGWGKQ